MELRNLSDRTPLSAFRKTRSVYTAGSLYIKSPIAVDRYKGQLIPIPERYHTDLVLLPHSPAHDYYVYFEALLGVALARS